MVQSLSLEGSALPGISNTGVFEDSIARAQAASPAADPGMTEDDPAAVAQVEENLALATLLAGITAVSSVVLPMIMKDQDEGGLGGFNVEQ